MLAPAMNTEDWINNVTFATDGLIPAIVQDHASGRILMMAWMNRASLLESVRTGYAVYWSRSRQSLWKKGATSGHTQRILDIQLDCDADVLLLAVSQTGGIACHTGRKSCFFRQLTPDGWQEFEAVPGRTGLDPGARRMDDIIARLSALLAERRHADPAESYVAQLHDAGLNRILEKVSEETTETLLAAKDAAKKGSDGQPTEELIKETADLWFHTMVMLQHFDVTPLDVLEELSRRFGTSGIAEKASRKATSENQPLP